MKRNLLILGSLLALGHFAQAQRAYVLVVPVQRRVMQYGVFGSFQSSWLTASNSNYYTFKSNGGNTGVGGGVYMDMFFTPHTAFHIGLNTASRGGKFAATYVGVPVGSTPAATINSSYDLKLRYFYLPLGLKFYTGTVDAPLRFYVQGLLSAGFLMGATNYGSETTSYTKQYSTGPRVFTYRYDKHVELLDVDASLGLGAQLRLRPKLDAFASVRYCAGLISAQHEAISDAVEFNGKNDSYPLHNRSVSVEAGVVFVPYRGKSVTTPPAQPETSPVRSAFRREPTYSLAQH